MNNEKLVRGIGRWDLTAVVINTIIGSGIFGLPSKVFAQIGSYSLFAFVACSVIIGFIVLCHAEVASRFTATGGAYLYAKEAFGSTVAFEVGWLYWIVRIATFAANCNLFISYLGFFWADVTQSTIRIGIIAFIVLMLAAFNIAGVRQSTWLTNLFTVGKMVPLFAFALIGLFFVHPGNFNFDAVPQYSAFTSATLLLIYAFVGFEVAVIPAGEMKDPKKNLPFALFISLGIVTLLYLLVQIVTIGTLPGLATSDKPLADAASIFLGPLGAGLIVTGALVSILGNMNVGLLGGSRIVLAMGEHRDLPSVFARTHERFKTPYIAIILQSAAILILTVLTSFLSALALATITRLIIYATTCLSLIVFRKRDLTEPAKFVAPLGIAAAILSVLLIAWLLANVDYTKEGLPIIAAAVIGLVIHLAYKAYRRRSVSELKSPGDTTKL